MKKNQFLVNELPYIKEKTSEINYSTVQLFVIFRFAVSTLNFQSNNQSIVNQKHTCIF